MMKRMSQGSFDMNDMLKQIGQLKMGGLGGIMSMLPGIGKLQNKMAQITSTTKLFLSKKL